MKKFFTSLFYILLIIVAYFIWCCFGTLLEQLFGKTGFKIWIGIPICIGFSNLCKNLY